MQIRSYKKRRDLLMLIALAFAYYWTTAGRMHDALQHKEHEDDIVICAQWNKFVRTRASRRFSRTFCTALKRNFHLKRQRCKTDSARTSIMYARKQASEFTFVSCSTQILNLHCKSPSISLANASFSFSREHVRSFSTKHVDMSQIPLSNLKALLCFPS